MMVGLRQVDTKTRDPAYIRIEMVAFSPVHCLLALPGLSIELHC